MGIYQHFRKHEHPFIDQVLSWMEQVERTFISSTTDFLDPREQQIVRTLIGTSNEELKFSFFGGHAETERKRAIIAPTYEEVTESQFEVVLLEASFPEKFVKVAHRDILGSFSGLGIDRKKIGDIIVGNNRFQIITQKEISPYVMMNLTQVKQANIELKEIPYTDLIENNDVWLENNITVSSLRLDVLVKEMYQMSRKDATNLIGRNLVKVNFTEVNDPAVLLLESDLLSVRGHGRGKLLEINGTTRKEKIRVKTARLKM